MNCELSASWGCLGAVKSGLAKIFAGEDAYLHDASAAEKKLLEHCTNAQHHIRRFFPAAHLPLLKWLSYEYDFFNIKLLLKSRYYVIDKTYLKGLLYLPPVCEISVNENIFDDNADSVASAYRGTAVDIAVSAAEKQCAEHTDFAAVELFLDICYLCLGAEKIDTAILPEKSFLRAYVLRHIKSFRETLNTFLKNKIDVPHQTIAMINALEKKYSVVPSKSLSVYDMYNPVYYVEYFLKQKYTVQTKIKQVSEKRDK